MINAVTGQFSRFVNFAQDRFDAERPWGQSVHGVPMDD